MPLLPIAGGGRLKDCSVAEPGETSFPSISVEAAGVRGRAVRGIKAANSDRI